MHSDSLSEERVSHVSAPDVFGRDEAARSPRVIGKGNFWSYLSVEDRAALAGAMTTRRVARGETLVEIGAEADRLFIVGSGAFDVLSPSTEKPTAQIRGGELIGEIGFFSNERRTATVVAARDSEIFEITRVRFDALTARAPGLERAVLRSLAHRLARLVRVANDERRPRPRRAARVVALIAAGARPLAPAFRRSLREAASRRASARFLEGEELDVAASCKGGFAIANWLADLEERHELLIFLADPTRPESARAALRSADELVLLAEGEASPPNALELEAFDLFPPERRRLLRFHESRRGRVEPTASWLARRDVFMTHHVADGETADFDRFMRFLAGCARGFVASGGGAYGPTHIGILCAFWERGVDFDIHGGTSVGAIMAAAFSGLMPLEEMLDNLHKIFVRDRALSHLTWPRYSLLDHRPLDKNLRRIFEDSAIEDLWKPYFAVATDLSNNSMCVIRSGRIWEAARASCGIPGALPPFVDGEGRLFVDGAVSDNAPLSPMKSIKAGPNVLVDLRPQAARRYKLSYDSLPGRWELLRRLVNPFARGRRLPRCPGPVNVILRSIFSNVHVVTEADPESDLVLYPPAFPGSNMMNWDRYHEVFEASREWARGVLKARAEHGDPALAALEAGAKRSA